MATRSEVLELLARGCDYPETGARLGITPGLAYLIATGRPADGSGTAADTDPHRPGPLRTSSQFLANPPVGNPTSDPKVHEWMRRRASVELS